MFVLGVITELFQINKQLEDLCQMLESEISIEDAEIDFDDWLENNDWINGKGIFSIESYHQQEDKDTVINHMTDYLPLGVDGYSFTEGQLNSFKTGMHQFCDDDRMAARDIIYAFGQSIGKTMQLLSEVKRKKTNIPSYLYEDYWYSFIDDYLENNPTIAIYEHWKEEHDDPDIDMLRDKQMQEILVLLKSGFLSHAAEPTQREIKNSIIKINKEAFDRNTNIPEGIDMECARLSKFVEWKDDTILLLKYDKLGRYIYKHHKKLTKKEMKSIAHFDLILDLIHEDIANQDSRYKIYLKNFEGDELKVIYDSCIEILNTCKVHLNASIDEDFFDAILQEVLYGDMKNELKSKLRGASRMTTLCAMLAACKNSAKVFKYDVIVEELAQSMSAIVERPSKESLKRYIDNGSANQKARIYIKTEEAIKNYLKKYSDNHSG
jgi:hypothetical protein